ncbi:MAG: hypothetical protein ACR2F2_09405 [Pyrinomonadaceae bacterium]
MNQIIEQDAIHSDEYYKKEIGYLLKEIKLKNEQMDETQTEIEELQIKSTENLKRIDLKIQEIENILT